MAKADIQQLRYLQEVYGERYSLINQEIKGRVGYLQELNNVSASLNSFSEISGKRMLNPIGADFYLFGTAAKEGKVVVGVGAGYLVEKGTEEAREFLSKTLSKHEKVLSELMKEKETLENAMLQITYRVTSAEEE
jgi:prefoldin alpha subunit